MGDGCVHAGRQGARAKWDGQAAGARGDREQRAHVVALEALAGAGGELAAVSGVPRAVAGGVVLSRREVLGAEVPVDVDRAQALSSVRASDCEGGRKRSAVGQQAAEGKHAAIRSCMAAQALGLAV